MGQGFVVFSIGEKLCHVGTVPLFVSFVSLDSTGWAFSYQNEVSKRYLISRTFQP